MNKIGNKFNFSLAMTIAFGSYALLITQMVPYLTHLGYSPSERGYVISFVSVISIVSQIFIGYLSDKFNTIKKFFIVLTVIMVVLAFFSFTVNRNDFWFHFYFLGFASGISRLLANLFETWIMASDDLRPDFGFIRSFGSMGWAVSSLASGFIIARYSYQSMAYVVAFLSFITIFMAFKMVDITKVEVEKINLKSVIKLFHNKNYVLLLFIYFVVFAVYNVENITITDLIVALGGTEKVIGVKWFIQAMFELPLLYLGSRLLLKYKGKKLIVFASIIMFIRIVLSAMAPNVVSIVLISTLQVFTFPLFLLTHKDLVYREIPDSLRSTGLMIAVSITLGLSGVIIPIVSGVMVEWIGIRPALWFFASWMIIPLILLTFYRTER